jgi:hypothetical protein
MFQVDGQGFSSPSSSGRCVGGDSNLRLPNLNKIIARSILENPEDPRIILSRLALIPSPSRTQSRIPPILFRLLNLLLASGIEVLEACATMELARC